MSKFNEIYKQIMDNLQKSDIWEGTFISDKILLQKSKINLNEILTLKFDPPINPLEEYINLSRKKVKLILERRFYKSLYNLIKKDSDEIEDKILKLLFQGIENKYSPEKCLSSL